MQLTSTRTSFSLIGVRLWATVILFFALAGSAQSQILYSEGFTSVTPLPAGWASQNNSSPAGTTSWFQGVTTTFNAFSGPATSYIGANFNNVAGANVISNWLFMPNVTLTNGDVFTFYTRVPTGGGQFPDRLQVRMSTNGASTDVGTSNTSTGDFSTLLLDINPTYSTTVYPEVWTQFTITISGLANPTSGRLAFRYFVEDGGPNGSNSNFIGIDDVVYTTFSSVCSGTPDPGNTLSSVPDICPVTNFSLSVSNTLNQSGLTYQWQSSPDNITWTNIAGATAATLTTQQNAATWYRLQVTCSGNTGSSAPLLVPMSAPTACYCLPPTTNCNLDDEITNVTFGGINNNSTCGLNGYTNYTNLPAGQAYSGAANPMSVTVGPGGTERVGVWIDYNHNGLFESSEFTLLGSGNGVTINGTINIPSTALPGITRMRVRVRFNTLLTGPDACLGYTFGETEDYNVTITPCTPVTVTTQPQNATTICGGNASFSTTLNGTFPTYQWETRTSTTGLWTNVVNGGVYSGATTATLTITEATSAMNGYQYRVVFAGGCSANDATNVATLTVSPLQALVNPTSATICNGSSQQFSITNTASAPVTSTYSSGPLSLDIPDNTANGVSHDITVSGIPPTAVITSMSVTINMTHTYCGDMLFNLRAPNGSILALDKYLTATAGQAGTYPNIGFVNTVISSTGTAALGTASSQPITGTFRADAINANITGATVQNPAGFVSNAANFAALYSVPNGAWTLAMADGGPADLGTLTSWSLNITYVAPTLATGVWSPTTGLFTDATLATAYTGNAVNTVYAAPTTTTNYSVIVTTNVCTSDPLNIPVTVANPISNVLNSQDVSICANGNASFTVTAGGNPIEYQWQVSTDGGTTYANITNGGVYSGATSPTLDLTNVPTSFNGNLYRCLLNVTACSSTATSDDATLTVNPNPTVSLTAAPVTALFPGLSTVITASSSPNPAASYTWYYNGVATNFINNSVNVNVDGLGEYTVTVFDINGCRGDAANPVVITDSLNTSLFIYPNPNTGVFQVRYHDRNKGVASPRFMNVYDSKGARVFSSRFVVNNPFGRMDVDLRKLSKGVYVIDLVDAGGVRMETGKVIIY